MAVSWSGLRGEKPLIASTGAQVPFAQVLTIKSTLGPQKIKGGRGLLVRYVP